jgi:hypothetical protein
MKNQTALSLYNIVGSVRHGFSEILSEFSLETIEKDKKT